MRPFVVLWFLPTTLFWGWHLLAVRDIAFSRAFHDRIFALYGTLLDVDASEVAGLFAHAFAMDAALVLALLAVRNRKAIAIAARRWIQSAEPPPGGSMEASRSSAP